MKKLLLATLLLPAIVFAENSSMVIPSKPLTILPMAQINMPAEFKNQSSESLFQQKKQGFHESDQSRYVNFLLNLPKNAPSEIRSYKDADVNDTHLKSSYKEIKTTFKPSWHEPSNIIGYAPVGTYTNGWTGIKTFFSDPKLGICAYEFHDMQAEHGAVILPKETTEYLVNKKPSNKIINGNYSTGFIYTVDWYTETSTNELDCANMKLDQSILDSMVRLSNKIDK